jgi:hypothetical protein
VAIIQRFGAALNLNVHVHALVLDGVYAEDDRGLLSFHVAAPPADEEMDRLIDTIERRIQRLLVRRGVSGDSEGDAADPWREEEPVLADIAAAAVQGRRALGTRTGAAVVRCGSSPESAQPAPGLGPCHARWRGFDLHAAVVVPPRDRARLERLCRYALRPPVAQDRVHLTREGQVLLDLLDGIGPYSALRLLSEIGTDMSRWPSEKHFTSWLTLAPHNKISGGRLLSSRTQPSANRAAAILRLAAANLSRTQTALGAFFRRIAFRVGKAKAVTATKRKLAILVYRTLKDRLVYADPGADAYNAQHRTHSVRRLRQRAHHLGFGLIDLSTGEVVEGAVS